MSLKNSFLKFIIEIEKCDTQIWACSTDGLGFCFTVFNNNLGPQSNLNCSFAACLFLLLLLLSSLALMT